MSYIFDDSFTGRYENFGVLLVGAIPAFAVRSIYNIVNSFVLFSIVIAGTNCTIRIDFVSSCTQLSACSILQSSGVIAPVNPPGA